MKNKQSEQSSTAGNSGTPLIKIPAENAANVNPDIQAEFEAKTLASAELLVEQGAALEADLLKHVVSSAAIMCGQGRLFGKAKRVLWNDGADDELAEKGLDDLYAKCGLAKSTMNRRRQMWDVAVDREIIDEELRHKIETSAKLTPELLKEMEARIGSISGTQFMRQLGILPQLEDKPKKKAKTAKEKIEAKAMQIKALVKEMQDLIQSDEVRGQVPNTNIVKDYYKLFQDVDETIARFKNNDWFIQSPPSVAPSLALPDLSIRPIVNP